MGLPGGHSQGDASVSSPFRPRALPTPLRNPETRHHWSAAPVWGAGLGTRVRCGHCGIFPGEVTAPRLQTLSIRWVQSRHKPLIFLQLQVDV